MDQQQAFQRERGKKRRSDSYVRVKEAGVGKEKRR